MIKNIYKNMIIATAIMATPLLAEMDEFEIKTNSLVGFEGGQSTFDYESGPSTVVQEKVTMNYGGVKIGAETEEYRIFLSTRMFYATDFDYMRSYGAEIQYLFNVSQYANFFLGVNAGVLDLKFVGASSESVQAYNQYVGADAGLNIHLGDTVDLELGARLMNINSEVITNANTYKLGTLINGYASIIFKYQMD